MSKIERNIGNTVKAAQLREWLLGREEIALIDVREEGQFGLEHPLLAVNVPYSRLESEIRLRVPLQSTRVVIIDADDGIAAKAIERLDKLGYANLHVLGSGIAGWKAAKYDVFEGTNVPSKAFAEVIETAAHTPHISAQALDQLQKSGRDFVVLDTRTIEEFSRFHVPGARSAPGVELQANIADLVPSADTLIVVSCAGRTRSIIGAQGLINVDVPNQVVSLAGGTQGWRIAGFDLETSPAQSLPKRSAEGARLALERAARLRAQHNIKTTDRETVQGWTAEPQGRTTYVFDVRTRTEFEAGHIAGARWAAGGQLVQALDSWVAVRNARLVLVDDDGVRATIAAHWLVQMGWEVNILIDAPGAGAVVTGSTPLVTESDLPRIVSLPVSHAVEWLRDHGTIVSTDSSSTFRAGHPRGAHWANRARLGQLDAVVLQAARILVIGDDSVGARLVAADLREITNADVRILAGGTQAWRAAQLPVTASNEPADRDRIDYLFWNHARHDGDFDGMRAYLQWELDLPPRISADGTAGFALRY